MSFHIQITYIFVAFIHRLILFACIHIMITKNFEGTLNSLIVTLYWVRVRDRGSEGGRESGLGFWN